MNKGLADSFTPEQTRGLLDALCRSVGLDPASATLLRHQTNAVYKLDKDEVIVKIARPDYSREDIDRSVTLTQWLMALGFPTVPLLEVQQPVIAQGAVATFWRYLPQSRAIMASDIALPLRAMHELPLPPFAMPQIEAVSAIRYSLDNEQILDSDDHAFLAERCDGLAASLAGLQYDTQPCLLHGDPQHGNALWSERGPVLCDWESAAVGHREWDLITIEIHCRRFGYPEDDYREFCRLYGADIREWPGYSVLRDVRELRMIATNARKSPLGSRGASEVRRRVSQLRAGISPAEPWSIL
jgi:Ser/Thr protein kinase RdoA (MazF antagonist)